MKFRKILLTAMLAAVLSGGGIVLLRGGAASLLYRPAAARLYVHSTSGDGSSPIATQCILVSVPRWRWLGREHLRKQVDLAEFIKAVSGCRRDRVWHYPEIPGRTVRSLVAYDLRSEGDDDSRAWVEDHLLSEQERLSANQRSRP